MMIGGQGRNTAQEGSTQEKSPSSAPTISLPKGGGAIRGIGEKFAANPVTGTGSMSVPLAVSPGRDGFGPQLALSYDSGAGNGPFGFGWSLSLPSITRKTDKGLPRYHDADESDVFLLSGAEDLVPELHPDSTRFKDDTTAPGFTIHRYRPRIEGLFARIERWTRQADGDVHWRSISKDNILSLYGKDPNARIADPTDPRRVFTWLLCETRDDKGNAVLYDYKPEDGAGVDLTYAHERNRGDRNDPRRTANRYLKRIRYGNRVPLLDDAGHRPRLLHGAQIQNAGWMFDVVFDYGEHDTDAQARQRLLPDTVMPPGLTLEEEREACRALKGAMLRQEVYALDGTDKAAIPYTVAEQNFTIRCLQPKSGNRHGVFFTHAREAISTHYERNPDDPRIAHALTLEVDEFGNVLKSLAIAYGRRAASTDPALTDDDKAKQTRLLITSTENNFTNAINDEVQHPDDYRTRLPAEALTYELTGFAPENNAARFSFDEWMRNGFALLASAASIPYEQIADNATRQKRLIEHVRTLYRTDDLTALLPLGEVGPLALPGESYKLALTPGLLAHVFKRRRADQPEEDLLPNPPAPLLEGKGGDQGGYVAMDGNWWIPAGRVFYSDNPDHTATQERAEARSHFFLPRRYRGPFGHDTIVSYDGPADPLAPRYDLLITFTRDALGNTVIAANDHRVLQPRLVTDPNRNRTAAAFDALSMVVATAVMGKEGENLGDLLEDFDADPPLAALQAFVADPRVQAASLLGKATTRFVYDLDRYQRSGQPPFAATLARETHFADPGGALTKIQVSFSYSDGFGREIQKKLQAEAGDAPQCGPSVTLPGGDVQPGALVHDAHGKPVKAATPQRWVGSGRTVFNNKGKPVRQYEPFFSSTHLYEEERDMTDTGVSPILFYDPVERVVATLHPNYTWEKVVFDPWRQETWDVNDTVLVADPKTDADVGDFFRRLTEADYIPTWYQERISKPLEDPERQAAEKATVHASTPTVAHFDTLGRTFLTIAHNKFERE